MPEFDEVTNRNEYEGQTPRKEQILNDLKQLLHVRVVLLLQPIYGLNTIFGYEIKSQFS